MTQSLLLMRLPMLLGVLLCHSFLEEVLNSPTESVVKKGSDHDILSKFLKRFTSVG